MAKRKRKKSHHKKRTTAKLTAAQLRSYKAQKRALKKAFYASVR